MEQHEHFEKCYHALLDISACLAAAGVEIQEIKDLTPSPMNKENRSDDSCSSASVGRLAQGQGQEGAGAERSGEHTARHGQGTVTVASTYIPHMVSTLRSTPKSRRKYQLQ